MGDVLVVEDDSDTREAVVTLLEISGYAAVGMENGLEALAYLKGAGEPSVILLDLMMPVMDGRAFRAAQLADPKLAAVPVIVMSACGDAEKEARRLGIESCIRKPVDPERLLDLVGARRKLC